MDNVQIDYYKLYCKIDDPDFLASLDLNTSESDALKRVLSQSKGENRLYIPDIKIEGLVTGDTTPYQALRSLYSLGEKRILFYSLTDLVEPESPMSLVDSLFEQSKARAGLVEQAETPPPIPMQKVFRRYALLNLEYPVLYFALKEEARYHELWSSTYLKLLYAAIRTDTLANALVAIGFPAILEFIQYLQSLFHQPITEPKEEVPSET